LSFFKLDAGILDSSLWAEPLHVRIVFITLGLKSDRFGYAKIGTVGLARAAGVTIDEARDALVCLESEDPESRSKRENGKRIVRTDEGWYLVNHDVYRAKDHTAALRMERMRERRARQEAAEEAVTVPAPAVAERNNEQMLRSVSVTNQTSYVSVSVSDSGTGEEGVKGEKGPQVRPPGSVVNPLVGDTRGAMNDRARALIDEIAARYTLDKAEVWKKVCRWKMPGTGRPASFISRIERVPDDRMLHVMDELDAWAARDRAAPEVETIPIQPMASRMWAAVIEKMKAEVDNQHTWSVWFLPCYGRRMINKSLEVVVPHETFRDWMTDQYGEACSRQAERPVVFVVGPRLD
jgi:hypothetical protein